jgi:hypothetical protein
MQTMVSNVYTKTVSLGDDRYKCDIIYTQEKQDGDEEPRSKEIISSAHGSTADEATEKAYITLRGYLEKCNFDLLSLPEEGEDGKTTDK